MQAELRQLIERTKICRPAIEQIIKLLPPDDAGLDALMTEIVAANDSKQFNAVTLAAAAAGRRLDARHLARGAMMFSEYSWMGAVALRMEGDVAEHLLEAIEKTALGRIDEVAALHIVAGWCDEHRGGALPEKLIPLARAAARKLPMNSNSDFDLFIFALLGTLSAHTKDEGLDALLHQRYDYPDDEWDLLVEKARDLDTFLLKKYRKPVLELIPERPKSTLAEGFTMRRAVARIGRNEPCPCGSGKKYKHCCIEKDHERLQHSSDVAGVTEEELKARLEEHLTDERLAMLEPHELIRLNPAKVPEPLLKWYFLRLTHLNLLDRAVEALEILGWSDKLQQGWDNAMALAARNRRGDLGQRLFRLREPHGLKEADLSFPAQFLLAGDDAARCLQLIEDKARKVLRSEDLQELQDLAYAVNCAKYPGLGILIYRGILPLLEDYRAMVCFHQLLDSRDRLNLPPDDAFSDIMDERWAEPDEEGESQDAAELRQAQRSLSVKMQEVEELKNSLDRLQNEIALREEKTVALSPSAPAPPSVPADESALKELRRKVEELKSALKERHQERNELRRELQDAHARLEEIQAKTPPAAEHDERDTEEALLLPSEPPDAQAQPVRLIDFSKPFSQALARLPRHVSRAGMQMIGRLASGEPAAFVGALRLKAAPDITRQRIGSDYRLLFRLKPDRMEVIDLINRKDLERRIKTLG